MSELHVFIYLFLESTVALFYLATITCHFSSVLHRACGRPGSFCRPPNPSPIVCTLSYLTFTVGR